MDKLDEKLGISTGLNLDLEREQATDTDWVFGALSQPCKINIPVGERKKYLPDGELQNIGEEKSDCATRGPINILETKFTYGIQNKIFSEENITWLKTNGYADASGRVKFSDRWIAVLSGTTRQGNSMKAPIDTIHSIGLIPKSMHPQVPSFTEYYDRTKLTNEMYALATEFKSRFTTYYEKVYPIHFSDALKDDLLNVAGYAWPLPVNGIYPATDLPINHDFVAAEKPDYLIFDNYQDDDFFKQLASDYKFFDWGYRIFIEENSAEKRAEILADSINSNVGNNLFIRLLNSAFNWVLKLLWIQNEPDKPVPPSIETKAEPTPEEIKKFEEVHPKYLWDTPENVRHSIRVICDEMSLSYYLKNVVCAVIQAESGFETNILVHNCRINGHIVSVRSTEYDIKKHGPILSTDVGLCQINDGPPNGPKWWIGEGKYFASVDEVLNDPEKSVRFIIKQAKSGNLKFWVAYTSGAYLKYMPK